MHSSHFLPGLYKVGRQELIIFYELPIALVDWHTLTQSLYDIWYVFFSVYMGRNQGTERLNNLSMVTWLGDAGRIRKHSTN